jgi:hypothetical protein
MGNRFKIEIVYPASPMETDSPEENDCLVTLAPADSNTE